LDEKADGVYCIFDQSDFEGLVKESLFWMKERTVFIAFFDQSDFEGLVEESLFWMVERTVFIAFLTKTILKAWLRKVFFG
jgi:hypothetical protein